MRFSCNYDYFPAPCDPSMYINKMVVDVLVSNDEDEECLVARLAVDHLNVTRAEVDGENIFDICDSDSSEWEQLYGAIFESTDEGEELRQDFCIDDVIFDVLFLRRAVFHEVVRHYRMFVLDHISDLFGESSAIVMWKSEFDFTDSQLANLGFRKIAGQQLLFRPNMLKHKYDESTDAERVHRLNPPKDTTSFIESKWVL